MPEDKAALTPPPDPDDTKGSLEDEADIRALRGQVPFRGFRNSSAFEIASPGPDVDSLPGESGEHGSHSGEDIAQKEGARE